MRLMPTMRFLPAGASVNATRRSPTAAKFAAIRPAARQPSRHDQSYPTRQHFDFDPQAPRRVSVQLNQSVHVAQMRSLLVRNCRQSARLPWLPNQTWLTYQSPRANEPPSKVHTSNKPSVATAAGEKFRPPA